MLSVIKEPFNVGDLVKMYFTERYGIITKVSNRAMANCAPIWIYYVQYADGRSRWELSETIELVEGVSNE
jgi:hypothetical protein